MKKFDIVCLSFTSWDADYVKSTVKLMSSCALTHKVIFVDYPYTWKDVLMGVLGKNKFVPWKNILNKNHYHRKISLGQNEIIIASLPPVIPLNWIKVKALFDKVLTFNTRLIKSRLLKIIYDFHLDRVVAINALNPIYGNNLINSLNEILLVYYCYDEISAAPWLNVHGELAEKSFIKKVDAVVTSSKTLKEKKSYLNENIHVIHNGVDSKIFLDWRANSKRDENHFVIGYLGSIDERLDLELLHKLSNHFSQIEIQFVGRITNDSVKERLSKLKNLKLLGPKKPQDLPQILTQFSLGMIPFVKNEFTSGIYPMKINEYLAMGLPVVSTRFGDMDTFEEIAFICDSHSEFLDSVSGIVNDYEKYESHIQERIDYAKNNTWDIKAKQLIDIISAEI